MGLVQFNGIEYSIPQDLALAESLDDRAGTYRISLGIVDPTEDQRAAYEPLFAALESHRKGLFLEQAVIFEQGNYVLKMALATLDVSKYTFGTFYELESAINDTTLSTIKESKANDRNRRKSSAKGEAIDGKRKTTNKRNSRISGA